MIKKKKKKKNVATLQAEKPKLKQALNPTSYKLVPIPPSWYACNRALFSKDFCSTMLFLLFLAICYFISRTKESNSSWKPSDSIGFSPFLLGKFMEWLILILICFSGKATLGLAMPRRNWKKKRSKFTCPHREYCYRILSISFWGDKISSLLCLGKHSCWESIKVFTFYFGSNW